MSGRAARPSRHPWSDWDSEASIKKYLASEAHQEIKRHNRNIRDASVLVKHYEQVR